MSKEQEQVRSRRQLRAANLEQKQGVPDQHPAPNAAVPSNPGVEGPSGAPQVSAPAGGHPEAASTDHSGTPAPRERQSQTRARDRAALRAYKELVEAAPAQQDPLPSRRALRQAQLDAERAPVTSINPVVPPAKSVPAVPPMPQAAPPVPQSTPTASAHPTGEAAAKARPSAKPTVSEETKPGGAAGVVQSAGAVLPAPAAQSGESPVSAAAHSPRVGRRAAATAPDALPNVGERRGVSNGAASPAVGGRAANQPAMGPREGTPRTSAAGAVPEAGQAPSTEELKLLAEQRAQSERAAVLDQRAQAREKLAQESAKSRRTVTDPTATNNLAMVTPMEFVDVPGADRQVMRPPITTHVPIVTRPTPQTAPARRLAGGAAASGRPTAGKPGAGKKPPGKPVQGKPAPSHAAGRTPTVKDPNAERFDAALAARSAHRPGPGNRPLTGGRSSTLQRAEAMVAVAPPAEPAQPGSVTRTQMPPMPADYAHGLEPLDAVTAGLGRTTRNLLIQWGSIILGGAALVVGAVMFITALAR